jgi:hypothetical protein
MTREDERKPELAEKAEGLNQPPTGKSRRLTAMGFFPSQVSAAHPDQLDLERRPKSVHKDSRI